jgi:hypothetical protein
MNYKLLPPPDVADSNGGEVIPRERRISDIRGEDERDRRISDVCFQDAMAANDLLLAGDRLQHHIQEAYL